LTQALYEFGNLKKKFNRCIIMDSKIVVEQNDAEGSMDIDLTEKPSEIIKDICPHVSPQQ
jgi:hypothetical protein